MIVLANDLKRSSKAANIFGAISGRVNRLRWWTTLERHISLTQWPQRCHFFTMCFWNRDLRWAHSSLNNLLWSQAVHKYGAICISKGPCCGISQILEHFACEFSVESLFSRKDVAKISWNLLRVTNINQFTRAPLWPLASGYLTLST